MKLTITELVKHEDESGIDYIARHRTAIYLNQVKRYSEMTKDGCKDYECDNAIWVLFSTGDYTDTMIIEMTFDDFDKIMTNYERLPYNN
jgi:hypothetical protein